MKKINYYLMGATSLFALPLLTFAGSTNGSSAAFDPNDTAIETSFTNILVFINDVIIPGVFAIGFLVFVWGMFKYFIVGGADDGKREEGKSLMIYATLGFVMIIIFWGVVNIFSQSTGLRGQEIQNIPTVNCPDGQTC